MLCQVLVYGEYGRLDQVIEQVKQEKGEDMVKVLGRGMRRGFTNRHCPKCNGNIFLDQDDYFDPKESYYGWYEWCLQCGFRHDLNPDSVLLEEANEISAVKELITV